MGEQFNYNIVLIGFMGVGKSTISEFLKTSFAMEVIEMDQIIAEREGMTISDIFKIHGEEYFRNLETNLLIEMQSKTNVVISCGGGTPMRECNVAEMKKNGRVVLLTAKPETILERVKHSHDRPLLENHKTEILDRVGHDIELEIVSDATVEGNDCTIETDSGVFNCSLGTQLENLIKDIRSLCS